MDGNAKSNQSIKECQLVYHCMMQQLDQLQMQYKVNKFRIRIRKGREIIKE